MAPFRLALALVVLTAALLLPRPVAAQDSLCELQAGLMPARVLPGTYWAEQPVVVENISITLKFCAPSSQSVVADQMLALAVRALPVLDELTDVRLDGSHTRIFFLDTNRRLSELNADGAIDRHNRILLHEGSLDSTVVHELAHYWADVDRFRELWMVEAYAEYLSSLAMPRLGDSFIPSTTPQACATLPLTAWRRTFAGAELCPYTAGLQVFHDLAGLTGEDVLRRVIGELTRTYGSVDSERLFIELERASGANLSPVMRGRVFGPEYDDMLSARATLHERYAAAAGLAGRLGASLPPFIFEDLKSWRNDAALAAIAEIEPVLLSAEATSRRCAELELPCARPWEHALGDPAAWAALGASLAGAPQLLSTYEQLRATTGELGLGIPEELRQRAGRLDDEALATLQRAIEVLGAASAFEGQCSALGLRCRASWLPYWDRGDLDAVARASAEFGAALEAGRALEARCGDLAARCKELWMQALTQGGAPGVHTAVDELAGVLTAGAEVERRCASMAARCGELWRAALLQGAAGDARALMGELEQLLGRGEALAERCGAMAESCARLWRGELAAGPIADARRAMAALEALLDRGAKVERSCREAGWPCADGWRAALAAGDPGRAAALLERQEAALPGLGAAEERLASEGVDRILRGTGPSSDPLAEAKAAFARGEVAEAEALTGAARARQARQQLLILVAGGLATVAAVGVLATALVARRRRALVARRARQAPRTAAKRAPADATASAGLLAQLLDSPPEDRRP